jgi:hypothetical protein
MSLKLAGVVVAIALGAVAVAAQGTQKDKPAPADWTGTLRLGVMAIGGETTGIILETAKEKFEIAPATDAVRADLKKLDGQKVTVHGTLARRPGVEVKERVIITVTKVVKAR